MYTSVEDFILNRVREGPYGLVAHNNAWVESHGGIRVYLRYARRLIDGKLTTVIDVASLASDAPGSGQLGLVFDEVERCATEHEEITHVYVENVHNERLRGWLERRGYTVSNARQPDALAPSYQRAL